MQGNFIKILHCHISPPIFVVNDFDEVGVVEVPGDDGLEDLLDDLLDKDEMERQVVLQIFINLK